MSRCFRELFGCCTLLTKNASSAQHPTSIPRRRRTVSDDNATRTLISSLPSHEGAHLLEVFEGGEHLELGFRPGFATCRVSIDHETATLNDWLRALPGTATNMEDKVYTLLVGDDKQLQLRVLDYIGVPVGKNDPWHGTARLEDDTVVKFALTILDGIPYELYLQPLEPSLDERCCTPHLCVNLT